MAHSKSGSGSMPTVTQTVQRESQDVQTPTAGNGSSQNLHEQLKSVLLDGTKWGPDVQEALIDKLREPLGKSDQHLGISDLLKALEERKIIKIGKYDVIREANQPQVMREVGPLITSIDEALAMEGGGKDITKADSGIPDKIARQKQNSLFKKIERDMDKSQCRLFKTMARSCLSRAELEDAKPVGILNALQREELITVDNYDNLKILLEDANLHQLSKKYIPKAQDGGNPKSMKVIAESQRYHRKLYVYLHEHLTKGMTSYESFLAIARTCLNQGVVSERRNNILDILEKLESENWIECGNYGNLIIILDDAAIQSSANWIRTRQGDIQRAMKKEDPEESLPECRKISERDRHHYKLYEHVNRNLTKSMTEYDSFIIIARGYIHDAVLKEKIESIVDVLCELQIAGNIGIGNYTDLIAILHGAYLFQLETAVKDKADRLPKEVQSEEGAVGAAGGQQ